MENIRDEVGRERFSDSLYKGAERVFILCRAIGEGVLDLGLGVKLRYVRIVVSGPIAAHVLLLRSRFKEGKRVCLLHRCMA